MERERPKAKGRMRIRVIKPRPSMETHLLHSIDKRLSGAFGQVISQPALVLVCDSRFDPSVDLTRNEARADRRGDIDRDVEIWGQDVWRRRRVVFKGKYTILRETEVGKGRTATLVTGGRDFDAHDHVTGADGGWRLICWGRLKPGLLGTMIFCFFWCSDGALGFPGIAPGRGTMILSVQ